MDGFEVLCTILVAGVSGFFVGDFSFCEFVALTVASGKVGAGRHVDVRLLLPVLFLLVAIRQDYAADCVRSMSECFAGPKIFQQERLREAEKDQRKPQLRIYGRSRRTLYD